MLELKMQVIKHYKNQVHMQKVGRQAIRPSRLKMIRLFRSKFVCLVAARKVLAEMRDQVLASEPREIVVSNDTGAVLVLARDRHILSLFELEAHENQRTYDCGQTSQLDSGLDYRLAHLPATLLL